MDTLKDMKTFTIGQVGTWPLSQGEVLFNKFPDSSIFLYIFGIGLTHRSYEMTPGGDLTPQKKERGQKRSSQKSGGKITKHKGPPVRRDSKTEKVAKRKRGGARSKEVDQSKKQHEGTLLSSLDFGEEDPHEFLLSRYVVNRQGKKVGESIGVEKNHIILKHGKKFYSVPFEKVQEKGRDLLLNGKVDWTIAGAKGERWRKKSFDMIVPSPGSGPEKAKKTSKEGGAKTKKKGGVNTRKKGRVNTKKKGGAKTMKNAPAPKM